MRATARFDVLIVGAGAAGCVLARRLSERGDRSIGLLEAGPDLRADVSSAMRDGWRLPTAADLPDWGFAAAPDAAGATPKLRRGRLLGGTSWLTRFAVRGAASDYDGWAAAGNRGWAYADVLPAFERLEADAELGSREGHGAAGPLPITRYPERHVSEIHAAAVEVLVGLGHSVIEDVNAPDVHGVARMAMSSRAGQRVTSLDAYLPHKWASANLTVRPDSPVDRVLLEGSRAVGVRLVNGTKMHAAEVILSAGVYGSPSILLRSGIGPADDLRSLGIHVVVDLPGVGANLADHPAVELASGGRGGTDGPTVHSVTRYRSSLAAATDSPDLMFWLTDPDAADPVLWLDPILLRPTSRGTVRLRTADPSDAPVIDLPGARDHRDVERLAEGYRHGVEVAHRLAARGGSTAASTAALPSDLGSGPAARRFIADNVYSIPHTVGTCAMGIAPDGGAVVDAGARVHGVEGLSVIDASIIPEPPSGFPHVITIMLAEHLTAVAPQR